MDEDNQLSVTSVSNFFFTTKSQNESSTRVGRPSSQHTPLSQVFAGTDGPRSRRSRVRLGHMREQSGLDRYSAVTNFQVTNRNTLEMTLSIELPSGSAVRVHGRPDGICDNIVVEHKRRSRGLLHYVPMHEKVQCHLYMKMLGFDTAHLVETFANAIHIHDVHFDDAVWDQIVSRILRWNAASDFRTSLHTQNTHRWKNVSRHASNNSELSESRPLDEPTFF